MSSCNIFVMISNFVIWWHENQYLFSSRATRPYGAFKDVRFNKVSKRHSSSVFFMWFPTCCNIQAGRLWEDSNDDLHPIWNVKLHFLWSFTVSTSTCFSPKHFKFMPEIWWQKFSLESKKVPQPNHLVNFWNLPKRFHFPKKKTSNLQCCNILFGLLGAFFCCSRSQAPSHIFSSTAWKCFFQPKLKSRKDHPESSLLNLFLLVWLYLII